MWRRFRRTPPSEPERGDYERTLQLIATAESETERQRLMALALTQIQRRIKANTNEAQNAVWQMEDRLGAHIDTKFGATNDILSDLVEQGRQSATGIGGLQEQVTLLGGMFSGIGERLTDVEATLGQHTQEIADIKEEMGSFRESRDASKERHERHELWQGATAQQLSEMAAAIQRIEALMQGERQAGE
jgi:chromosome segregation ATPase